MRLRPLDRRVRMVGQSLDHVGLNGARGTPVRQTARPSASWTRPPQAATRRRQAAGINAAMRARSAGRTRQGVSQLDAQGRVSRRLPVRAVVVDFDGTACSHDVAEHLLDAFADPSWRRYDEAWDRGEMGAPDGLSRQATMLEATTAELIAFALEHCPMDPTFAPFVTDATRRACR